MTTVHEHAGVTVLHGDCRDLLRAMPADSVDCCVTSPPYYGLRDYGADGQIGLESSYQEYIEVMVSVFREVRRVLKPTGTLWLNLGDSYATWPQATGGQTGLDKQAGPGTGKRHNGVGLGRIRPEGPHVAPNRLPQPGIKPKDIMGIPWRVAFALQADGWWLRQDIVWAKPNPMPESIGDRCTKAHEYLFLLARSRRYHFDARAIQEPVSGTAHARGSGVNPKSQSATGDGKVRPRQNSSWSAAVSGLGAGPIKPERVNLSRIGNLYGKVPAGWDTGPGGHRDRVGRYSSGNKARKGATERGCPRDGVAGNVPWEGTHRNKRSVWTVTTKPYSGAHFAVFPEDLVVPCILAGCPEGGVVLDPFGGSGTVGVVAKRLGRRAVLCELSDAYCSLAIERLTAVPGSLFAGRNPEEGRA